MRVGGMVSTRFVSIVAVAAFVMLLVIALSRPPEVKTREQAVKFALDDLNSDASVAAGERLFKIFSANYSNETGQWTAIVKITLSPHSQCPTVLIRTYQLLPIRHGLDKTVTQNCQVGSPIAFEEEAIIASRAALEASFVSRAYACGYRLPFDAQTAREYCNDADEVAVNALAAGTPGAKWAAEWRVEGETKLVAMDELGKVVKVQ